MAMFTSITHQNTPEGRREGNHLPEGRQEDRSTKDSTLKSVFYLTMHVPVIVHSTLCPCSSEYQRISQQSLSLTNVLGRGFPDSEKLCYNLYPKHHFPCQMLVIFETYLLHWTRSSWKARAESDSSFLPP